MFSQAKVSRNVLMLLCAMSFIMYVDRVNLAASAGLIKDELHLSNTDLGLIFSAFAYTYAVFQVIGGWFSDRFGAKLTLLLCASVWVIATISVGFISGFVSLFLARLLLGVGEGAALPAQARALTNWFNSEKRGFVQGITHSFARLGNAITPPLIAFLVALHSWRFSFIVIGVLTSLWIFVWGWYFVDNPRKHPGMNAEEEKILPAEAKVTEGPREAIPWLRLLKRMAPTMAVYFCYGWTSWLFFTWLPTFFMHGRSMDLKGSALFSAGVFMSGVVGNTVGGLISDKVFRATGNVLTARRNLIIFSFSGALVFLLPVITLTSQTGIAISLSLAFFFLEMTIAPIWAVPMDITARHVGIASGLMNAGSAIAGILSPIVFGYIVDTTGNWTLPFVGSIGFLLLGIALTFLMRPDRPLDNDLIIRTSK